MTRSLMARRSWAALLSAATLLLAACGGSGGGDGNGSAQLRVLNLTNDVASLDVYLGDNKTASAVATDAMTNSNGVEATGFTVKITNAGSPTALFTGSYSFSRDQHYTGVVWGRSGSLKFATLPEDSNTDDIASGNSRIRVYNATSDVGAVDVFLTTTGQDDLSNVTATAANVLSASLGGYKELSAGDYRLRVTGAGDINDVRLDLPLLTLTAKQFSTLIITAGPGGVLVNGASLLQQGALTPLKNTQARLRLVAGADAAANVALKVDGVTRQGNLRSPRVGPYILVDAGARTLDVSLNGAVVSTTAPTLAAGADYTLMLFGTGASGQVTLVNDDNRLAASGRYRIRLLNAASGVDAATLSVDFKVPSGLSDISAGMASQFATGTSTTAARLDVSSSNFTSDPLTDVKLQSTAAYSVFVLGGNSTPAVTVVQER